MLNAGKLIALAGLSSGLLVAPAVADPWTRSYVVEWSEQAAYFGSATGGLTAPGTDCPKGTEPELNLKKVLVTSYRSPQDVDLVLDLDKTEKPENLFQAMTMRGLKKENIYKNPKAAPDVGMLTVQGKIAEGFNLDGDTKSGFTSPSGEKGIDNNFYKAWGCWEAFRGPTHKANLYHNDEMRNGKFTALILISGNKGPRNDDNVKLGLYSSKDKVVKDANGDIAADFSFRIADDKAHTTILDAKIVDGVLTLTRPQDIKWREASFIPYLTLFDGQARFTLNPDGTLSGMLGGYKPIQEAIATWTIAGPNVELVSHVNLSAAYYAIERAADARPDPESGENTAISTAVRYFAVPAFIIKSDASGPAQVAQALGGPTPTP